VASQSSRLRWDLSVAAIVFVFVAGGCASGPGTGSTVGQTSPLATGLTSPAGAASAHWTFDDSGPTPTGMLPLGPTAGLNEPPGPCQPGIPILIAQPKLYEALAADQELGDQQVAGVGEVVNYDWGGHRPVAADSLRVTVPSRVWTLRLAEPLMRLVIATSDGVCFAQWRVTARPLAGYDGAQDTGSGWYLLSQGSAQTDAAVVEGLPRGEWVVHVHLVYSPSDTGLAYSSESYVGVIVGDQPALVDPEVPAPDPAVDCTGQSLTLDRQVDAELIVGGETGSTAGVRGTASTGHGGRDLPATMPAPSVQVKAGRQITVRTVDGTCGNDWSGFAFMPVPDALDGPFTPESGLPTNDGADPTASTPQLVGAINGLAPAPGEWLLTVMFWFGGPDATTYYWRISVS
jgi:hypothetical protein